MTVAPEALKRALVIEVEGEADPALAPPVPDDGLPPGRAMEGVSRLARRRASPLARLSAWVFGALFMLVLSVSAWNFVAGLFAANPWLGWLAGVLTVAALALAGLWAAGEALAFLRLGRLDRLRTEALHAAEVGDLKSARAVVDRVTALYAGRDDMAWGRQRLADRRGEVLDADALLRLAEVDLMTHLDAQARGEIEGAARQVAAITAFVPLALADVASALVANLRMIRRIAEIYGGRSGNFGSWRLMRRVFISLVAAGAVALTDDLLGSVAGGGILSRLSRRFGEGVVNGALTARVGLAAMDLCRPLPFAALERPGTSATISRALAGFLARDGEVK